MKKKEVLRLYNIADAELVTLAKAKAKFMSRDLDRFEQFGVTATHIQGFESTVTVFSNTITDIEKRYGQMGITKEKENKAEEVRVAIRGIMTRVQSKFGLESSAYRKFGTEALSQQTDSDLLITAARVVRVGTEQLDELAEKGLKVALLTELSELRSDLETLIIDQKIEIGVRDDDQENRVEAGNTIYTQLVDFANTGKNIWETTDVAKYNDYIIYNTVSGSSETPPLP